jgi:hypothetical protein
MVSQFTTINYQLSLSSDSLNGPYTTNVSTTVGTTITLKLNQVTAGPVSNVNLSFGDGSPVQTYTLTSSYVNFTKNYTAAGTYTISAAPVPVSLTVAVTVNNMTVVVTGQSNNE